MEHLAFRLVIALLTFIIGMAIVRLLLYPYKPSSLNQIEVAAQSQPADQPQPVQSQEPTDDQPNPLEAAFIKGDTLSFAGHDVERSFNATTNESSATIKKNDRILATFSNGGLGKDSTEIGLFPFLGGATKQLVIMQYTGGAHCCWIYKIYDLSPSLHPLFDGENYGTGSIGYNLYPIDIDGDGRYEFTQSVMTFDYFHMSHASSVFPPAVFSYDEKKRMYLPANHKFSRYVLEGMEKDLKSVEEERAKIGPNYVIVNERYLSAVLQVVLKHIYAGQEAEGWEYYDREYHLYNKAEIKADIRKALRSDSVYQTIYRRRAT